MDRLIGQKWGNYELIQSLGKGGFAEVYLGKHIRLDMRAAIKILHAHLDGSEIQAFQQEAKTIADLRHPHIVRVLDFDVREGRPFLVIDYAPYGSLGQKHPRGVKLALPQVVGYVEQIASALQHAHDRKVIHRDVKPGNILLGEYGELLLTDFGIATIAHSTSSMNTEAATGTLAYMAPEQIQGKPRPASDQYALAITVYLWLSGNSPFQGSSTEVVAQHLAVAPPSFREKNVQVPEEVEQVIMTALRKDPQERFKSVQAFAKALAQAAGIPLSDKLFTSSQPLLKQEQKPVTVTESTPQVPVTVAATVPVSSALTPQPLPPTEQAIPQDAVTPEQPKTPPVFLSPRYLRLTWPAILWAIAIQAGIFLLLAVMAVVSLPFVGDILPASFVMLRAEAFPEQYELSERMVARYTPHLVIFMCIIFLYGFIDFFVSWYVVQRTEVVRWGIFACLWAKAGYILVGIVTGIFIFLPILMSMELELSVVDFLQQLVVGLGFMGFIGIFTALGAGWLGALQGKKLVRQSEMRV